MPEIARQWFIPGDGIDRHVISADIQRYLGNDATVRPGLGSGENQNIQGYWIKAYRNLTSAMISDLQQDSQRWRQEQAKGGSREYANSKTFNNSRQGLNPNPRASPVTDSLYGTMPVERIPVDRSQMDSRMQIDTPVTRPGGYPPPMNDRAYPTADGRQYAQGPGNYPPQDNRIPYQQEQPMAAYGGPRPPVTAAYDQQPRYVSDYPSGGNIPQQNYVRQGEYMVPAQGQYDQNSGQGRPGNQYGPGSYPQHAPPPARNPREPGYPPAEYQDPRYAAYPSPAATISSVVREPAASPPHQQQSSYGNPGQPQYDPYGRLAPSPFGSAGLIGSTTNVRPPGGDAFGRPADGRGTTHGDRRNRGL